MSVRSPIAPNGFGGDVMILIGVDVHKQSVTAVAVDEPGTRGVGPRTPGAEEVWGS
jgi:Na+-translocating ferredoxin:NAD+ oxidoreductase RnfG subunit